MRLRNKHLSVFVGVAIEHVDCQTLQDLAVICYLRLRRSYGNVVINVLLRGVWGGGNCHLV